MKIRSEIVCQVAIRETNKHTKWKRALLAKVQKVECWPQRSFITLDVVSEMTYTVSSGTLNPSIPYHTITLDES